MPGGTYTMRQSRPSGHSFHSPTWILLFQSAGAGPSPSAPSSSHAGSGMRETIVTRSASACSSMARAAARDSTEPGGKSQGRGIRRGKAVPLVERFTLTLDVQEPLGQTACRGVGFKFGLAHSLEGST